MTVQSRMERDRVPAGFPLAADAHQLLITVSQERESEPFSDPQTVIPTPYPPQAPNGPQASILAPRHVQERMYAFPDVMRGQQCLSTDQETNR